MISKVYVGNNGNGEKNEMINKILLMLDVNDDRFYSNEELAETINVHPRTLHNYFVEIVGMPVHRYQDQNHLAKAHKLLSADSSVPLSAVAEHFGFCDEYHFSKYYNDNSVFHQRNEIKKRRTNPIVCGKSTFMRLPALKMSSMTVVVMMVVKFFPKRNKKLSL